MLVVGLWLCFTGYVSARQDDATAPHSDASSDRPDASASSAADGVDLHTPDSLKTRLVNLLPNPISEGLDIDAWGWFAFLKNNQRTDSQVWDGELSLAITKSFNQRVAISAQVNFIDANDAKRIEWEQAYISTLLSDEGQSLLTIGKFNANFGVEPRDFWNRRTGTTSLLFSAQPQDLVGAMVTLPIGESGIKLRPFISADFQGEFNFDQSPSVGLLTEYRPCPEWTFAVTNWVGPGFVLFGGRPLPSPYPRDAYGSDSAAVVENWQGPNLTADRGGTLYFFDAKASWRMCLDFTVSAEYLVGTSGTSLGRWGWQGWMLLGDYDITDRVHVFGRWSYLDDSDWLVTGIFQRRQELSCGLGYQVCDGIEIRGEYRHDFSNATAGLDTVSVHLTFTF